LAQIPQPVRAARLITKKERSGMVEKVYLTAPRLQGKFFLIDREDLESFRRFFDNRKFSLDGHGYIQFSFHQRQILLHRWILNAPNGTEVDHIDHDPLNNCRSNLRLCLKAQNQWNREGATKRSKSGIRGVSWDTDSRKWVVQLQKHKRKVCIGYYHDKSEAEKAAKEARREYFGQWSS
jgi:hypothetical protein